MSKASEVVRRHFTTRRGFAVLMGLLVLALYFLWAAYDAAPTSLRFLSEAETEVSSAGHGGHGAGGGGMTPEEFAELTEKFIEDFSLEDGSVKPGRLHGPREGMHGAMDHAEGDEHGGQEEHEAMESMENMPAMTSGVDHSAMEEGVAHKAEEHEEQAMVTSEVPETMEDHEPADGDMDASIGSASAESEEGHAHDEGAEPIDVYLMAMQFSYMPTVLRLEHGVPYRFRMMSMDVNHGASIHTGFAGHIMRRPARTMVEMNMTFSEPGEYMIYCTVYCGDGHDMMKGKIIVE